LPPPELNPLVNPLLGQNMGRWAEVYFTSPPEKREEAVLNLLRELEENATGQPSNSATQREVLQADSPFEERPPQNFTPAEQARGMKQEFVPCQSCGTKNPPDQKFCGQCGLLLPGEPVGSGSARPNRPSQAPQLNELASFSSVESAHDRSSYESTQTFVEAESEAETRFAYDNPRELPWLREVVAPKLMPEYEPVPYRYRIYVGAALAVLIAALVYIAWRGTQVPSGNSHALPQAAPGATKQPPAQTQTSPSPVAASPAKSGSQNDKANVAVPPDKKATDHQASHATARMDNTTGIKNASDLAPASTNVPAERADTAASLQDNGARELAVAEGYLKGGQGKTRDSTQAAKWLWQAVRKQNAPATLILSDLYLRGDGVPKSCDQGRLLLDAAARKGAPGAGERIRNLQAFGCQ
jgi:hypothetical protein